MEIGNSGPMIGLPAAAFERFEHSSFLHFYRQNQFGLASPCGRYARKWKRKIPIRHSQTDTRPQGLKFMESSLLLLCVCSDRAAISLSAARLLLLL